MVISRRLVAVVFADIAGYSRLMERDETGTHQRLRALRDELLAPRMAEHGGRLVHSAGDGLLVAFESTTSALRWSIEIQRDMAARNFGIAPDDRIEFRIGVNLGDVIVEGTDIVGEDVNLAERLETLAAPGGICVAAAVREQMHEDLGVTFVDAGTHHVKNFAKPVHLYRVVIPDASSASSANSPSAVGGWTMHFRPMPTFVVVVAVAVLLAIAVAAGLAWWQASQRQERGSATSGPLSSSILVAPFVAMSGEPGLQALAPGLGRDVARALANSLRDVSVVGPEFEAGAGKDPRDERALARAANVRYVLSSSVGDAGEDIVVTARLVDGTTAAELGSERRTIARVREKEDRDLLVTRVTAAARLMFQSAEGRRIAAEPLRPDDARSLVAHANALFARDDRASTMAARKLYERARERDPTLVAAWTGHMLTLGWEHWNDFEAGRNERLLAEIDFDSRRALALDDRDPNAWFARAVALTLRWQWHAALEANDRAIALDPARARFRLQRSLIYYMSGRASDALHEIGKTIVTLGAPDSDFLYYACHAHIHLGQYEEAIDKCGRAVVANNSFYFVHLDLTVAYAHTGDMTRAGLAKAELMRRAPDFTIARFVAKRFSDDPVWQEEVQTRFLPGLRKAGVPER